MDMNSIQSIAENVVTPVSFDKVTVSFEDGIVSGFAETYVAAINNKLAVKGSNLSFDPEDMRKYLNTLLRVRIDRVNNLRTDPAFKRCMIPALYALTLDQIGTVYDKDLGISIVPSHKIEESDVMKADEAIQFSRKLQIVEDIGFELVEGLPTLQTGSSDFMFLHMAEDKIVRHDKAAHPAYAVLAAFFRLKQMEVILTHRVNYGLISEYELALSSLIHDGART